ncbi:CO2 hydration protein [Aetokthonos hydrillicola Thurmond2011]|jgi:CO2 hydration protein|uniref:CO2 hydration protein n=1 Tax=Aetokthonos hydrillicola Thurmond2011 TaxID=2712845 RepID=A0AAP5IAN7_9CYAN|nr:CO2 hydration protein [Aetokthonos hydrillicola]MBO3460689.1 CO2 hydration protein [Aetokthonos hydrillicola CCALA 1050]MBW4587687.1 CO2 hydration protein [Aetokthonos hydrillicola CCALA 1050]MDR9897931.1 CO2 hydration protein [Aetokthonos hydrillicola Thurmond2011]
MVKAFLKLQQSTHPLSSYIDRLENGDTLLPDSPRNLVEVVGILHSYGIVLDAYSKNLCYIAENAFLEPFPIFKYFNGEVTFAKLLKYGWHDRINFEYAEYCMKAMLWHGGEGLDTYLNSPRFEELVQQAIAAKFQGNPIFMGLNHLFPGFFREQIRQLTYYSALGQFWRVMSDIFCDLSERYNRQEITSIPDVVEHIQAGLVAAANLPITYSVLIRGECYDIIPKNAGLEFLKDVAVPYVEAVFFRGTPFFGTISYNAQANQIPQELSQFNYGVIYADPLPIGGAGIPPTLLMQDMRHFLPDYLQEVYECSRRGTNNLRVQICRSFQKSMFCVTTSVIKGLAPYPLNTSEPDEQRVNRAYLESWMNRFLDSRLPQVQL